MQLVIIPITTCLILGPSMIGTFYQTDPDEPFEFRLARNSSPLYDYNYNNEVTNVLFYTFFKCGIDPDCIDITVDDDQP